MVNTSDIEKYGLLRERLCLDFTNTSDEHPSKPDAEFLHKYAHLVEWATFAGAVSDAQGEQLLTTADAQPEEAASVLQYAITVRDTIYRVLSAAAAGQPPAAADMESFNAMLSQAMTHMQMATVPDNEYRWIYRRDDHDLGAMLWPVLWSASVVLTSRDLHHLRECASDDCTWLFLDTSKNHSRRWCSMTQCGNRAKARTHYHRVRKTV